MKKISWDRAATENFRAAIKHIRKDSVKNAGKVKQDIISKTKSISFHPEKYPPDKYKVGNDGTYRAFEQHHLRIVYRILQTEVKIISVRHTSMEPREY